MRVLQIMAGGQPFAVPVAAVSRVGPLAADQPATSLARRLGLATSADERKLLYLCRTPTEGQVAFAIDAAGSTEEVSCLPWPSALAATGRDGESLPFMGVARLRGGLALVLDGDRLVGEAAHSGATGDGAASKAPPAALPLPDAPLLIGSPGLYRLRGRPLAVALPLATVRSVRAVGDVVPLPLAPLPGTGLAVIDESPVPVFDAAVVLGLPESSVPAMRMVVFDGGAGPAALRIAGAAGVERPRHWASPALLAPIASEVILGTLPRPERWVAVLDPARIGARGVLAS
ncbi:MAG: chemotaxis protein CheW [Chloroflexota bacterium]